jgi:hypothetical protein
MELPRPEGRHIENRLPSRLKLLNPLEVAVLLEFQGPEGPICRA